MRTSVLASTLFTAQLVTAVAFAAEESAPKGAAPSAPEQAAPSPAAPAATTPAGAEPAAPAATSPAPAVAKSGVACVVGYHPPEYPDSARTATELVCEELRNRGVPVGGATYDPGNAASAYFVHLDQLGSTFFLRVVHEEPVGTVRDSRRISMANLAEAEVAAPRVADAITKKAAVKETERYDNLVGSEARRYQKKKGEVVAGVGIAGLSMPASDEYMGPAFNAFIYYETTRLGLGLQLHVGDASTEKNSDADFIAWSVGGRYYFSDGDITPLAGLGLALASIDSGRRNAYTYEGSGLTAFGEVGVEFFRLYSTHLITTLRVDAPFFTLNSEDRYYFDGNSTVAVQAPDSRRYEVPITLNIGVGF